jgi:hypothetical protein
MASITKNQVLQPFKYRLLATFKKANQTARKRMALRYGYKTTEQFLKVINK